jgi:predicted phosphodiesterase
LNLKPYLMRIIAIGDLHGKDCWKQIDFNLYEKVIFIGDYVDSFNATNNEILNNLLELIQLKKSNTEKFILLLGNHDIQYRYFPNFRCSGFRPESRFELEELFRKNQECFQVAYQYKKYLFTHAGVSNSWWNQYSEFMRKYQGDNDSIGEVLNKVYLSEDYDMLFDVGFTRGGNFKFGGIVWADKSETQRDYFKNIHQVVGHTPLESIRTFGDENSSITYIDVLNFNIQFYELIA